MTKQSSSYEDMQTYFNKIYLSEDEVSEPILSERGYLTAEVHNSLMDSYKKVSNNAYDSTSNPQGIVDLGIAVNCLMEKEVCDKFNQCHAFNFHPRHQHYFNFSGTKEHKQTFINLLTRHFQPLNPILPSHMVLACGTTSCLDSLSHALCDPGDVIITPTPTHGHIFFGMNELSGACIEPLVLEEGNSMENSFVLKASDLEQRILDLKSENRHVRAFILVNPQNPLGQVYPPDLVLSLLQVCARHKVHVIMDEVYGLSVFDEKYQFRSVLTLDLPDPDRTHVVWAISKDFGLPGLRVGVIISQSQEVHACLEHSSIYKPVALIVQEAVSIFFSDVAWCDEVFLPTNRRRLAAAYQLARERLEGMGAEVRPATAGLFIWFNVKPLMNQLTHKEDLALHQELLQAGVFTMPGQVFYNDNPGWMRIVYTVNPQELEIGLDRLEKVLSLKGTSHVAEPELECSPTLNLPHSAEKGGQTVARSVAK